MRIFFFFVFSKNVISSNISSECLAHVIKSTDDSTTTIQVNSHAGSTPVCRTGVPSNILRNSYVATLLCYTFCGYGQVQFDISLLFLLALRLHNYFHIRLLPKTEKRFTRNKRHMDVQITTGVGFHAVRSDLWFYKSLFGFGRSLFHIL